MLRGAASDFPQQPMYGPGFFPAAPWPRDLPGESRRNSDPSGSASRSTYSRQARDQARRASSPAGSENAAPASSAARWRSRPASGLGLPPPPPRMPGMPGAPPSVGVRAAFRDITNEGSASANIAADGKLKVRVHDADYAAGDQDMQPEVDANAERYPAPVPSAPSGGISAIALTSSPLEDGSSLPGDSGNVQSVAEYATEIYDQLFQKELMFLPRHDYMDSQSDINGRMRAILIDWLVEVHMKYRLRPETLFLALNILDRYLSSGPVARRRLQLVGVVSMLIAAKFEEITPPEVHDFVYITDNAYTKEDILTLETTMLTVLGFQVVAPTALNFIERFSRANRCDGAHRELVQYLVELSLSEIRMIRHTPSHLAAAAVLLSNGLLGRCPLWPPAMTTHSRCSEATLRPCAEELRALLDAAPLNSLQAVRKKYLQPHHHSVARMTSGTVSTVPSVLDPLIACAVASDTDSAYAAKELLKNSQAVVDRAAAAEAAAATYRDQAEKDALERRRLTRIAAEQGLARPVLRQA